MQTLKLSQFLKTRSIISEESSSWKQSIIYILIAYIFGLSVRLLMFFQVKQIEPFWDGSTPVSVWHPDAGRYGYYAKSILSGVDLPYSSDYLLGHLIASVVSLTGFSIDWVMLILPIVAAPLIVVPVIMMGNSLKTPTFGFLVALVAVSGKFFYSRSYLGYIDTDWGNLLLILTSIAFIMLAVTRANLVYALSASLSMIFFGLWYHSSSSILLAIVLSTLLYLLLAKDKSVILPQIFIAVSISILPVAVEYKVFLLLVTIALFYLLNKKNLLSYRHYLIAIVAFFILGMLLIDPNHYLSRAMNYLNANKDMSFTAGGVEYIYPNDLQVVSEAVGANIWHSSGPTTLYTSYIMLGTLGYLLILIRYRVMLITLPLIVLGYASSFAGSRFDMYATVAFAFGIVHMFYMIRYLVLARVDSVYTRRLSYYLTTILLVVMVWNIFYLNKAYMLTLNYYADDKHAIEEFGKTIDDNDTIVNSWDYGWPLWYYTGHDNTVSDNGYHGGPDTNLIYKIFMSTDQNFTAKASLMLANGRIEARKRNERYILPTLLKDQNYTELLSSIKDKSIDDLYGDGDVYIFLHSGMLDFYYTMLSTASLDLHGHIEDSHEHFKVTSLMKPFSKTYSLVEGYAFILDSNEGMVTDAEGKKTPLNSIMITDKHRKKYKYTFHKDAKNYMFTYGIHLYWIDEKYYNSFYIQAMIFDTYDKNLFEKVAESSRVKIFRIKR
ncbi:Oligosaccharyltransferase PglB [hydrothermal vent metagenome]|uniref:Oligosaccharyltransferase PglB n=1 Tax=hydrothermal vent metagenome TaxID=652676 RepID=A0A1W1BY22_9ZZZZ